MSKMDKITAQRLELVKAQIHRIKGGDERKARCRGENEMLAMCDGKRLTQREAIYAQCFICMGYYVDGRMDCKMPDCSLYPFMPYRENKGEKTGTRRLSPERVKKLVEARHRKAQV